MASPSEGDFDRLAAALAGLLASAWRARQAASEPDEETARDHEEARAGKARAAVKTHDLRGHGGSTL